MKELHAPSPRSSRTLQVLLLLNPGRGLLCVGGPLGYDPTWKSAPLVGDAPPAAVPQEAVAQKPFVVQAVRHSTGLNAGPSTRPLPTHIPLDVSVQRPERALESRNRLR